MYIIVHWILCSVRKVVRIVVVVHTSPVFFPPPFAVFASYILFRRARSVCPSTQQVMNDASYALSLSLFLYYCAR